MWSFIIRGILYVLRMAARGGASAARTTVAVSSYGRIAFTGLIRHRQLTQLTHQEIRNAMTQAGMREAHNAHFISRLIERGSSFGLKNLDDLATAINNGVMRVGRQPNTVEIVFPKRSSGSRRQLSRPLCHLAAVVSLSNSHLAD